jgi:apolipoprotein N-acyltransferase
VQTQQIASSRLRAIESGRWVVQAAPTGFSAFVTPSGEVLERSGVSEQVVRTHVVARRAGETWFVRWGQVPVYALAAALVAVAWLRQPRRRRATTSDLEQQRDRTVVDEGDLHLGAEASGGHRGAPSP